MGSGIMKPYPISLYMDIGKNLVKILMDEIAEEGFEPTAMKQFNLQMTRLYNNETSPLNKARILEIQYRMNGMLHTQEAQLDTITNSMDTINNARNQLDTD